MIFENFCETIVKHSRTKNAPIIIYSKFIDKFIDKNDNPINLKINNFEIIAQEEQFEFCLKKAKNYIRKFNEYIKVL